MKRRLSAIMAIFATAIAVTAMFTTAQASAAKCGMGPDCPPVYRCQYGYICFYDGDPAKQTAMVKFFAGKSGCQTMSSPYRNRTSYIVNHSPFKFQSYANSGCKNGTFQNTGIVHPYSKGWMTGQHNNNIEAATSSYVYRV